MPGGSDCSISFVSHVLGKVCVHGRQSEWLTVLGCGAGKSLFLAVWQDDQMMVRAGGDPLVLGELGSPGGSLLPEATQLLVW